MGIWGAVQSMGPELLQHMQTMHTIQISSPRGVEIRSIPTVRNYAISRTNPNDKTDTDPAPKLPTGVALTALNPVFRDDPHRILNALRVAEPVHRDIEFDRVFLTRHADVRAIINDRTLSVDPRKGRCGGKPAKLPGNRKLRTFDAGSR